MPSRLLLVLRSLIESYQPSYRQLARASGVDQDTITGILHDDQKYPHWNTVKRLAEACGQSERQLTILEALHREAKPASRRSQATHRRVVLPLAEITPYRLSQPRILVEALSSS